MPFNSFQFLIFFVIFFGIFFFIKNVRQQIGFTVFSCFLFYGFWNPWYILLLFFMCCVAYISQVTVRSRKLFVPSLIIMIGTLFIFKYYNFFNHQLSPFGYSFPMLNVALPVGISFYTFRAISFAMDKKRGIVSNTQDKFMNVVNYISFFPQLAAGPIVRSSRHLPQLIVSRKFNPSMFKTGLVLIAIGIFKKLVIADNLGAYVDEVWLNPGKAMAASHWLSFYFYGIQIYYDFSGYSDMAIGIARILGFKSIINFNRPYLSASVTEFWRRWHISLSSWLRDYLYIALGGNRKGKLRTHMNLMIVMLLAGLWHGAAWTFVAWGGLLGCFLIIERIIGYNPVKPWPRIIGIIVTAHLICISWVFFRAHDLMSAVLYFRGMADLRTLFTLGTLFTVLKSLFLVVLFIVIEILSKPGTFLKLRHRGYLIFSAVLYIFLFLLFGSFVEHPFIYFQF
jgi:alginate O-acetyltransferase complex protein AlgI